MSTSMTPHRWRFRVQADEGFLARLSSIERRGGEIEVASRTLARALARGGGARAEREALLRIVDGLQLRVVSVEGAEHLELIPVDPAMVIALDLLGASDPPVQLRRCFYDGNWFLPALRSARSKFCNQSCRNRFNYEMRERQAQFVCVDCGKVCEIDRFSGLALEDEVVEPADVRAAEPLCVDCVATQHPEWVNYVSAAELTQLPAQSPSGSEYSETMHRHIRNALEMNQPQSLRLLTEYVASKMQIKGRRSDLTILGHLLRFPGRYRQVAKNSFALTEQADGDERGAQRMKA